MASFRETWSAGLAHLRAADPVMAEVIRRVGERRFVPRRDRFAMLARSILFQQLSTRAARAIHDKLLERLPEQRFTAAGLAALADDAFRASGVSAQKTRYLRSLSEVTLAGEVRLAGIARWSDERIIEELIRIKGVGVWTAQMFLIFSLGRPDVLPWDDLGVRQAIRKLYGLPELPDRERCAAIAAPWRPYASVASWYCWRSLELKDDDD